MSADEPTKDSESARNVTKDSESARNPKKTSQEATTCADEPDTSRFKLHETRAFRYVSELEWVSGFLGLTLLVLLVLAVRWHWWLGLFIVPVAVAVLFGPKLSAGLGRLGGGTRRWHKQ